MEGHARLHVDEREVVAERVVQLARDPQALLARAAQRLLLLHPDRLGLPFVADPDALATPNSTSSQAARPVRPTNDGAGPWFSSRSSHGITAKPVAAISAAATRWPRITAPTNVTTRKSQIGPPA